MDLTDLQKDKARLDWLLKDLECSSIGGSDDLDVLACERASVENPDMWYEDDEDYWRHYLVVCREAIDAAMKEE